jgi:predicted P-loop ATPase
VAEAVVRFQAREPWWLDTPELIEHAKREQQDRFEADPWQELVARFLEDRVSVSIDEVLTQCLFKLAATWTQADKNRLARILAALGWERKKIGPRARREWRYFPQAVSQSVSQFNSDTGSPEVIDPEAMLSRVSQCPSSNRAHA